MKSYVLSYRNVQGNPNKYSRSNLLGTVKDSYNGNATAMSLRGHSLHCFQGEGNVCVAALPRLPLPRPSRPVNKRRATKWTYRGNPTGWLDTHISWNGISSSWFLPWWDVWTRLIVRHPKHRPIWRRPIGMYLIKVSITLYLVQRRSQRYILVHKNSQNKKYLEFWKIFS